MEVKLHCDPFPDGCGARRLRQRQEKLDDIPQILEGILNGDDWFQILPCSMDSSTVMGMLNHWPTAAGTPNVDYGVSATDNFLAGDDALFVGQWMRDWDRDASDSSGV